jgi:hypothetical protein
VELDATVIFKPRINQLAKLCSIGVREILRIESVSVMQWKNVVEQNFETGQLFNLAGAPQPRL